MAVGGASQRGSGGVGFGGSSSMTAAEIAEARKAAERREAEAKRVADAKKVAVSKAAADTQKATAAKGPAKK